MQPSSSNQNFSENVPKYDVYDNHPATRLRNDYSDREQLGASGSKDFSSRLDENLQEMCVNISRLKGLASELGNEIESQNDLIGNIIDKTDKADLTITKQNKDMKRILKK